MASIQTLAASEKSAIGRSGPPPRSGGLILPAYSLCRRELVRFLRQRHRIIGALGTPIFFWLCIGAGMGHSFNAAGTPGGSNASYIQYFFPGTVLMILLFTAIFSTISLIEDRREGFLQSVLVAPIPRMAIVLGKILGGTILAFGQAFLFLLLAPLIGVHFTAGGFCFACTMMFLIGFSLTALAFCIAWRMTSTQGFHAIMNLFLMPLWFLSGALFPADNAWWPIRYVMKINPLSYGLEGIRRAIYFQPADQLSQLAHCAGLFAISVVSAIVMFLLASKIASSKSVADLQA